MVSPWRNPLPLKEYATKPVVLYSYKGRWIPIMFYEFEAALTLYLKGVAEGCEFFIFPAHYHPCNPALKSWNFITQDTLKIVGLETLQDVDRVTSNSFTFQREGR